MGTPENQRGSQSVPGRFEVNITLPYRPGTGLEPVLGLIANCLSSSHGIQRDCSPYLVSESVAGPEYPAYLLAYSGVRKCGRPERASTRADA